MSDFIPLAEALALAGLPDAAPPGLAIDFHVQLNRQRRAKCPVCGHRRVLFALAAYAADSPIGYGIAKCLADAGIRRP